MSTSASFISSIDSSWKRVASRSNPQLANIFASTKYWLIAVSSAVSTSLRSWTMSAAVFIRSLPFLVGVGEQLGEQLVEHGPATPAVRAGAAASRDLLNRASSAGDDLADGPVVHGSAAAHVHPVRPYRYRRGGPAAMTRSRSPAQSPRGHPACSSQVAPASDHSSMPTPSAAVATTSKPSRRPAAISAIWAI